MNRHMGYFTPEAPLSGKMQLVPLPVEIVRELANHRREDVDPDRILTFVQEACRNVMR